MTAHALGRISQAHTRRARLTTFDSFEEGILLCLCRLKKFDIPLSDKAHDIVDN